MESEDFLVEIRWERNRESKIANNVSFLEQSIYCDVLHSVKFF
jgi:hypothetical protein